MTLPLPDPRVDQKPWEEERAGVQRNFDALAQRVEHEPVFVQAASYTFSSGVTGSTTLATPVKLTGGSEVSDAGALFSLASDVITCSRAGTYVVAIGGAQINTNASRDWRVRLRRTSGTATDITECFSSVITAGQTSKVGAPPVITTLAVGDTLEVQGIHTDNGISRTMQGWVVLLRLRN